MAVLRLAIFSMFAFASTVFAHGRLEELMNEMREDYRYIQMEMARDPSSPGLSGAASRMKLDAIEARGLEPHKVSEIRNSSDRARAFKIYQNLMDQLISEIGNLEMALIRRDSFAAGDSMGRIADIQRRGHELFD